MLRVTGSPGDTGLGLAVTDTVRDCVVVVVEGTDVDRMLVLGVEVTDVVVFATSFWPPHEAIKAAMNTRLAMPHQVLLMRHA